MSNSDHRRPLSSAITAATLLLLGCVSFSEAAPAKEEDGAIPFIHDFLQSFYPALFGKNHFLQISFEGFLDHPWRKVYGIRFEVKLDDPHTEKYLNPPVDPQTGKRLPVPEDTTFLTGSFWFDDRGGIREMWSEGPVVESKRNEAIHQLVEAHPEWSEAQAIQALKDAGARYGPGEREQLLQSLHLEKAEKLLGRLKTKSLQFNAFINEQHEGSFANLTWSVKVDAEA